MSITAWWRKLTGDADQSNEAVKFQIAWNNFSSCGGSVEESDQELHEDVSVAAYYRYVERGRLDGHDTEDWLAAEQDVLGEVFK